ncbi:unnamed protein product [Cylindrotheca closterium]|uniref:Glycosyltransferase 61 catalytic domain-containing protein n=1 Tax=Cylindrotheca closterium TaxID=2856 RepID=A0AAD2FJH7_9STRA|nr:unnamed protein product [Cylindrotheca closterium]
MRGFSLIYITHDQADDTEKELLNNPSQLKTMTKPQGLQMGPSLQKSRDGLYMTPRIVNQSTAALYRKHWSPIPVAIPFRPHQCTNFGHVLGDNVFAMFRILKNFGLYHPELQFLPIRADCVNKDECGDRCSMLSQLFDPFLKGPVGTPFHVKGIFRNYYKAALDISAKQHQQMKLNPSSLPLLCFENVLSGLYYYADHGEDPARHGDGFNTFLTGSGDKLLEFRDQYMIRLGLDPNRHLSNRLCQVGVESASILIVPRRPDSNRISGWHDDKLIAELQKTLPNENVTVVDFSIHGTRAQVKLASTAKVLVSMAGGASYLAWFLAPGASALVLKRWGTLNDAFIWENFPYIKKSYFSATSDSASNRTEEVFDYVNMSKSVEHLVQSYDRRFCEK